jgi:hypothetical protein
MSNTLPKSKACKYGGCHRRGSQRPEMMEENIASCKADVVELARA